jgi:hypothetical protein
MSSQVRHRRESALLLSLLFLVCVAVIWIRTETVKVTYQYVLRERMYREVTQNTQVERLKWLKMTAPGKLETIAASLDLRAPAMGQVMKVGQLNRSSHIP